ncbi:DUF5979 domain-containing protein [Corynebacterium sp. 35RC1]|nr:DUF5979 domain-containing protein [Corynebacterium sp. 35RC1]
MLALGITLLSVGSHSAAAQETNKFELSNVKVTKTGSWPATVDDSLTFTADWAVKAGETVKAGDVMKIAFSQEAPLDFASNIGSFPLKRGDAEVATCRVAQDVIECTFSDSVIAGAEAIGGSISVGLTATAEYSRDTFPVTLNGELKTGTFDPAPNPGTCVICPRTQGLGREVSKSGRVDLSTNPGFVQWSITIPGPLLVDNQIGDLNIVDTVEGNHTFVADKLYLYMVTRNADGTNVFQDLKDKGHQYATGPTVSDDGKTLTATFPKPASGWNKEYKYEILYRTQLPANFIPANNEQFNNQFSVDGKESFSKSAVARVAQASGTADAASRVAVKKTVSGENLTEEQLADLKTKTFTFDYTCGELKGTLEATGDGTVVYSPITFTVGTKCTVTEDETQAGASGYKLTVSPQQAQVVIGTKNLAEFTNTYSPITTSETTTTESTTETTAVSTTSESTPSESTTPVTSTTESSSVPPVVVTSSSIESSTAASSTTESSTEPSTSTASSTVPTTPPTPAIPIVPAVPVVPATPTVPAQPTQPAVPSSPTTEAAQATEPAQPAQTKRVLANTGVGVGVLVALALSALLGGLVLVARGRTTN